MNQFMKASERLIHRHGRPIVYTQIQKVVDKIQGTVVQTKTNHTVRMYPKSVKVSQYNYPDLIGKSVVIFYVVVKDVSFTPAMNDSITLDGKVYTVRSYDSHEALGENCVYRITGAA